MNIDAALTKYDLRVPRYTSYPTAAQFTPRVGPAEYASWLAELPDSEAISLYLHVPFCDSLCHYCGCNTAVVRRDGPRRTYAQVLQREIALVSRLIGRRLPVAEIHWGGGTPTSLPADCLAAIARVLRESFAVTDQTQVSVEIDPRSLRDDALGAMRDMGMTRASLGVQDFDPVVQQAIGRVQDFACVEDCMARLRNAGARSINLDLIYGLPFQTESSVCRTVGQAVSLRPDRIAAFGYAHVPWMKRRQALMPEAALPDPVSRFRQRAAIEDALTACGYRAIGLDHYALPEDSLTQACDQATLHRNFQGYTTDKAAILLGFGASAIGSLPQGHVQNVTAASAYMDAIRGGTPATARGVALTPEDRLRGHVIEQIMCHGHVDLRQAAATFASDARGLFEDARALKSFAQDGLVKLNGDCVDVTGAGRPFLRSVAAVFDVYWQGGTAQHATAV